MGKRFANLLRLASWFLLAALAVAGTARWLLVPGPKGARAEGLAASSYTVNLPVIRREWPLNTIFGVETQERMLTGQNLGFEEIVAAQVTWVRRNAVFWADVEPTKGSRDWSVLADLEEELIEADQKGIKVILIVRRTPTWAQKYAGFYCGPIKQSEMQTFGDFMYELVARYSKPPYNVRYWEIWNEPDAPPDLANPPDDRVFGCWGEPGDFYYGGGYYAEALKAAYPRIKAADPNAVVLVGGLLMDCKPGLQICDDKDGNPPGEPNTRYMSNFLEGILEAGGGPYFDGVSFHAYDFYGDLDPNTPQIGLGIYSNPNWGSYWYNGGPVVNAKTQFLKQVLAQYGYSSKLLFNTETGVVCGSTGNEPDCETSDYEMTKAYYVPQTYAAALAQGIAGNVWYSLFGWQGSELLDSSLSPLPAYTALSFARKELANAAYVSPASVPSGVRGYEFLVGGKKVWVVWSEDGNDHSLTLPSTPTGVYDSLGNAQAATNPLNVTFSGGPLYIELP